MTNSTETYHPTIIPTIRYNDAIKAIEWLREAFIPVVTSKETSGILGHMTHGKAHSAGLRVLERAEIVRSSTVAFSRKNEAKTAAAGKMPHSFMEYLE